MQSPSRTGVVAFRPHSDGGDLLRHAGEIGPHTRVSVETAHLAETIVRVGTRHGVDHRVFEMTNVGLAGGGIVVDRDDGPGDHLTGCVIGDVAATISVDHHRVQLRGRNEEVLFERAHAAGIGRRVLEQQHVVVARLQQGPLEVVGLGEAHSTEVAPPQHLALALEIHPGE